MLPIIPVAGRGPRAGKTLTPMLVLARQRDQTIMIGDDIEVTVVDVRGEKVRLGITAPRCISVHRKEVYQSIHQENREAASVMPADVGNLATLNPSAGVAPDPFMLAALEEARAGLAEGGLPIGSVLVRDGQIIGRGRNRRVQDGDPMRHAEIDCLARAGRQKSYKDTVLYTTLSPCHLCSGAALQFGIPKVVVGESVNFPGARDSLKSHGVNVVDLDDPECIKMMRRFIETNPTLWHEDIGR